MSQNQDLARLRRQLADDISITANHFKGRAAASTVEALMFSLRERGIPALDEPDTRRRLSQLNDSQLLEVAARLQKLKPEIARAWSADEVETLMHVRETFR
jgi:hypothetical protein